MRILQLTDIATDQRTGGSERYTQALTERLRQRGHEVRSCGCPRLPPTGLPGRYHWAVARTLHQRTSELLADFDADVIHAHHPVAAWVAGRLERRPIVRTLHGDMLQEVAARRPWARGAAALGARCIGTLSAVPDALISPSPRLALATGATLIPGGVDLTRFGPRQGNRVAGPPVIGALTRLAPERGLDALLRAVAPLEGVALRIAGDGPERSALKALADRLELTVEWLGQIEDAPSFLQGLDIYVGAASEETFGLAILEAMACGLPVIALASEGARGLLGTEPPAGVIVDQPSQMAAAIRALIDAPEHAQILGQRGAARASSYDWMRVAEAHEAVYQQVLRCRPS